MPDLVQKQNLIFYEYILGLFKSAREKNFQKTVSPTLYNKPTTLCDQVFQCTCDSDLHTEGVLTNDVLDHDGVDSRV